MSTESFDKNFIVNDQKAIKAFMDNLSHTSTTTVSRNVALDDDKGIQLLRQRFLSFKSR
jgi:hypothetical protein